MELSYRQNGDYLIPNLTLETETPVMLGKYGRMRRSFLKSQQKGQYSMMLLTGSLNAHLTEIDQTAKEQVERMTAQIARSESVTERLKAENQMEWVRRMNGIRAQAEEIVMQELIRS